MMVNLVQVLLCLAVMTVGVLSSPVDSAAVLIRSPNVNAPRVWPQTSVRKIKRNVERKLNNAERIKRGLPVLSPVKLYDPSRAHAAPRPRISQNPAPAGDTEGNGDVFDNCYATIMGYPLGDNFEADSDQDAVNECSSRNVNQGNDSAGISFAVQYLGGDNYACSTVQSKGSQETCTASDYAVYRPTYF